MGEDLSQGTKVAVILILLCSVIAIVFSILAIMKNITATATQDMQGTLSSVTKQKFDDYDQRVVTGAQVVAACKLFSTQDVGIIVYTNRTKKAEGDPGLYCVDNLDLETDIMIVNDKVNKPYLAFKSEVDGGDPTKIGGVIMGNYADTIHRNEDRGAMNKTTSDQYVSNTARFNSYLIKTTSGDIIGILFDEV